MAAKLHGERKGLPNCGSPKERMKKNQRIAELLERLGRQREADSIELADMANAQSARSSDGASPQDEYGRAAFMLGEPMLERIGIPEGISPIAIVVTLLRRMDEEGGEALEEPSIEKLAEESDGTAAVQPGTAAVQPGIETKLPRPMRGGMGQAPETDYFGMSSEDFRNLREKLKRASMDGRRVRI